MDSNTLILEEHDVGLRTPSLYAVIIHNDDITSMDFVVEVLTSIFHMDSARASILMMAVHKEGHGVAGVYTYDIAVTKKTQADQRSAEKGFPLKLTISEVPN